MSSKKIKPINQNTNEPEIIKALGNGIYGVTYLANYHNNLVAFKKAHILKSDIDNKQSRYHAMLAFYEQVANKFPNHFTHLIKYEIIENCKFDFGQEANGIKAKKEVHESPYCLYMITTPVLEDTLKNWYNSFVMNLNDIESNELDGFRRKVRNEIYAFLTQYVYIYYIMESFGWYHTDSKWKNVMYLKEEKEFININLDLDALVSGGNDNDDGLIENKSEKFHIPSYGKRWFLIDYDPMYSDTFYGDTAIDSGAWRTARKSRHVYLIRTLEYLLFQPFWKPVIEKNLNVTRAPKTYELIISDSKTKYIKELLPNLNEYDTLKEAAIALAIVLEPESYFKFLGLDNFLNSKDFTYYLNLTKQGQYFDIDDLKYYIKNLDKPKLIIKRLASKLNEVTKK